MLAQSFLVDGVVGNASALKVEDFAHRLQALQPVISYLFLEESAARSEKTVERFRTSVGIKRNHIANNGTTHNIGIDVVRAKFAFQLTLRVCDRSARTVVMDNTHFYKRQHI